MTYSYQISAPAEKYLRRLSPALQEAVLRLVKRLCADPFGSGLSTPLHGQFAGYRRARVGNLRVLYTVERDRLIVVVTAIGPRGDVYKS